MINRPLRISVSTDDIERYAQEGTVTTITAKTPTFTAISVV